MTDHSIAGAHPAAERHDHAATGVYAISGVVEGGVYIGASTNLDRRQREHFSALENDRHYNPKLQAAYRRQGKNNFIFVVIQTTEDPLDLCRYEQENINHYGRNGELYNLVLAVPKRPHPNGYKLSEETRERQSRAQRGRKVRIEQTRARLYRFMSPNGKIVECLGLPALCKRHRLNQSHMSKLARGKLRQHLGWTLPP